MPAKIAEVAVFVNMVKGNLDAKNVVEVHIVNIKK
jgi:hypothetical protein